MLWEFKKGKTEKKGMKRVFETIVIANSPKLMSVPNHSFRNFREPQAG